MTSYRSIALACFAIMFVSWPSVGEAKSKKSRYRFDNERLSVTIKKAKRLADGRIKGTAKIKFKVGKDTGKLGGCDVTITERYQGARTNPKTRTLATIDIKSGKKCKQSKLKIGAFRGDIGGFHLTADARSVSLRVKDSTAVFKIRGLQPIKMIKPGKFQLYYQDQSKHRQAGRQQTCLEATGGRKRFAFKVGAAKMKKVAFKLTLYELSLRSNQMKKKLRSLRLSRDEGGCNEFRPVPGQSDVVYRALGIAK